MQIKRQTGTANTTASPGRKIEYLAIHYTAGVSCKAGSASGCASWFANQAAGGSADYIVDEGTLIQYNPDPKNRYCHAVGGTRYATKGGRLYGVARNANCVSLEICSGNTSGKITVPNDPKYYFTDAVLEKAKEATKQLMAMYGIDSAYVIRHYDVNGKCCPGVIGWNKDSGDESKWKEFHAAVSGVKLELFRVRLTWLQPETQLNAYYDLELAKKEADQHPGFSVFDENGKAVYTSAGKPDIGEFTPEQWIALMAPIAKEIGLKYGILTCVLIAQASLETGWGKTDLAKRYNVLGMKADLINSTWSKYSTWNGVTFTKSTPEYKNGKLIYKTDVFRTYKSYKQCFEDYAAFLLNVRNDKGYKYRRVQGVKDPAVVIHYIRIGTGTSEEPEGYCTDPAYETKIMNLIRKYNLTQYDAMPAPAPAPKPDPTPATEKTYRVQIEADKKKASVAATKASVMDKLKLECFDEKGSDGYYHVYCGSFSDKSKAEARKAFMQEHGYPKAFIVEKS